MKNKLKATPERLTYFLTALAFLMLLSSCTFPRLYILKDPLTPEEHLNLGVSYEEKGELDNAIKEYRLASKKLPGAYVYLGNAHFLKKEWAEAEKDYKEAIQKDPQNADAYNNLAWLYCTTGENLKEAEALALKALELNPAKETIYRDTLEKIRKKGPAGE
jgi:tetratricopeptide (TPR) repeat protein